MNIDPKKMKKKDLMFMDFFSMYGKNFINNKKGIDQGQKKKAQKAKGPASFKDMYDHMQKQMSGHPAAQR